MPAARNHLIRFGTTAALAVAGLGVAATAAGASTSGAAGNSGSSAVPAALGRIKAKANTDITERVNALDAAVAEVDAGNGLGSGQAALVAYLDTDITPLQQLDQKIQGDTSVKPAAQDYSDIFTDFRVYVLVLPAARFAGDADRATATAIPALQAASSKAQGLVNPQNQAQLQPLVDDLNSQISAASNATNGLAATVLADTPAQWNADHTLLSPDKSADQTTDAALRKGRSDVQEIRQVLRGAADPAN
jgi:uncharacterized protein YukE